MSERKEKFTPGPWEMYEVLDHNDNPRVGVHTHPDQETIYEEDGATREDRANSHLIAAAPDLYEVLSDTVQFIGWDEAPETQIERILDRIEAALVKARGGA